MDEPEKKRGRRRRGESRAAYKGPSTRGKLIAAALLLACVGVILYSAKEFRADILHWEAHYMQQRWQRSGQYPPQDEIQRAQALYVKALQWMPNYPAYHDALAHLYRLELQHIVDGQEYLSVAQKALQHTYESFKFRPIWPYGYSRIPILKYRLGQFDDEWKMAYRKALEQGPWEEVSLVQLAEAGAMAWFKLNDEEKTILLEAAIPRSLAFAAAHAGYLRWVMDQWGSTAPICAELASREIKIAGSNRNLPRALCEGVGA